MMYYVGTKGLHALRKRELRPRGVWCLVSESGPQTVGKSRWTRKFPACVFWCKDCECTQPTPHFIQETPFAQPSLTHAHEHRTANAKFKHSCLGNGQTMQRKLQHTPSKTQPSIGSRAEVAYLALQKARGRCRLSRQSESAATMHHVDMDRECPSVACVTAVDTSTTQ